MMARRPAAGSRSVVDRAMRRRATTLTLFASLAVLPLSSCASAGRFPELPHDEQLAFNRCWYNVVEAHCGTASLYQEDCARSHRAEYAEREGGARETYLRELGCAVPPAAESTSGSEAARTPAPPEPAPAPRSDADVEPAPDYEAAPAPRAEPDYGPDPVSGSEPGPGPASLRPSPASGAAP